MKHLTHWILALLAITTVASFSGAWTTIQEPQKKERKMGNSSQGRKDRAVRHAAILKAMPTLKVTLTEAIALAEKETSGKAFAADIQLMAGKPTIQVQLFVSDKYTNTTVDPETKKVTISRKGADSDEEGEEEGEEGG